MGLHEEEHFLSVCNAVGSAVNKAFSNEIVRRGKTVDFVSSLIPAPTSSGIIASVECTLAEAMRNVEALWDEVLAQMEAAGFPEGAGYDFDFRVGFFTGYCPMLTVCRVDIRVQ